jgi:hypothetical protein
MCQRGSKRPHIGHAGMSTGKLCVYLLDMIRANLRGCLVRHIFFVSVHLRQVSSARLGGVNSAKQGGDQSSSPMETSFMRDDV